MGLAPKRDTRQFQQACKELGFTDDERFAAGKALHYDKGSGAVLKDMSYAQLLRWLREWEDQWRRS